MPNCGIKWGMEYAFEERIGNPELFVGRKAELKYFLQWINNIKGRKSKSTALLARRKTGKTAIMERLFNITFYKNDGVIPFYYEIKEGKQWVVDFCKDFFLTCVYQYIAFKSRKKEYLNPKESSDLEKVCEIAEKEGLGHLTGFIESVAHASANESVDTLWLMVRDFPKKLAADQGEFIVQMIDEFQFLNSMIYRDKNLVHLHDTLAGGYLSTAESKVAPLLVSGSWVGWLMNLLSMMLPARFKYRYLKDMPEDEAIEMIYKYSQFFDVPVTDETAYLLAGLTEGSPFYISAIMCSDCPDKDLTRLAGLTAVLEFETLDDQGTIKLTWMEYIASAFPQINNINAKNIVLYLSKNRHRELTRKELLDDLNLDMTDAELERKLKALIHADIIKQGASNFRYRGVNDDIFDKVFRGVYEEEIHEFDVRVISKEYLAKFRTLQKKYNRLLGKYNYRKGYHAEYAILDRLRLHARRDSDLLKSITRHLPVDFAFCEYDRVWRYDAAQEYAQNFNVDIFARAVNPGDYSIIGEVKSRDTRKFSKEEAVEFERKFAGVKKLENISRAVGFIFSRSGFTSEAEDYCKGRGIALSDDDRWLDTIN